MATEQFRKWRMNETITISYVDGSGIKQIWAKNQQELLNQILSILNEYATQGIRLTSRQLYYQLVATGVIPNADEIYKRICTFLTDGRYSGLIDWDAIEDRGRTPEKHGEWDDVEDLVKSAVSSYRLPRWSDQKFYVELYVEKQALESVLKPVADKYHIYFGANKGYSSASTMYELAQRIKEQMQHGKKCVVLYLGDHDSSGLDMVRDIRERIIEFLLKGDEPVSGWNMEEEIQNTHGEALFQVVPLALNMEQIRKYSPPPNPAKMTDPRARWYVAQFGEMSWELDALKPQVLIKIVENGIQNFLDVAKYNAWIEREKKESEALEAFGRKLAKKEKRRTE